MNSNKFDPVKFVENAQRSAGLSENNSSSELLKSVNQAIAHEATKENSPIEICNILQKMQKDSLKDKKWIVIGTIASVIASVASIVSIIIALL